MKISARNQFHGTISELEEGAVNAVVVLDIGGGNHITATISKRALHDLGLKVGSPACAFIKATSVMIATE